MAVPDLIIRQKSHFKNDSHECSTNARRFSLVCHAKKHPQSSNGVTLRIIAKFGH